MIRCSLNHPIIHGHNCLVSSHLSGTMAEWGRGTLSIQEEAMDHDGTWQLGKR